MSNDSKPTDVPASDCPLSSREQTRNIILNGINVGLVYVASPALYVGAVHAALLNKIGASEIVANLPTSLYFWLMPTPVLVGWYFCKVRLLRPILVISYLITALCGVGVMAALLLPPAGASRSFWVTLATLAHGGAMGCTLTVVGSYQWEVLGRGVSQSRRGQALGLAFGLMPILAFLSSLGAEQLRQRLEYPWDFASLFAISVPTMLLAALLSCWYVIPLPAVEVVRQPFKGLLAGIGDFFSYRLTLLAAVATLLVNCGYNIGPNFTLYTEEAVGEEAATYVNVQNAWRFAFKVVAGIFLGWMLTRMHPRAGLMVTGGLCLASVLWIMFAPGQWFLLAFGLMGAGELWGVYYPNYILSASAKSQMRRNMAITYLIYMPSGFAPVAFGAIARVYSLRTSFVVSIIILVVTLLFVQLVLPARPRPPLVEPDAV